MSSLERPRLVGVSTGIVTDGHRNYLTVSSRDEITDGRLVLIPEAELILERLDGTRTVPEVAADLAEAGVSVSVSTVADLVDRLAEIGVIDTPEYRRRKREIEEAFLAAPVREPVCAGSVYSDDPDTLRAELRELFTTEGGPGLPDSSKPSGSLRGILTPHMDYRRGRTIYPHAWKELAEHADPTLALVIATSHYSARRFILTRKSFRTPLGIVPNATRYTDALAEFVGGNPFDDELAHKPEHSIELELPLLQFLFEDRRTIPIVPVLIGSFHDTLGEPMGPSARADIGRLVAGLKKIEELALAAGERVVWICSGDLAHIGPKFGDPWKIDSARSLTCRRADEAVLDAFRSGRADALHQAVAAVGDERRLCGFPPGWTMLEAMGPTVGRVKGYDQFVDPYGFEIVSFAAIGFHRE